MYRLFKYNFISCKIIYYNNIIKIKIKLYMETNTSNNNNKEKNDKLNPIVKIGKEIFILRTLYLIAKKDLFKSIYQKSISFYLKYQLKEQSLLYLPQPQDSDIIIENIKELIELTLSLCILTNSSNYKISVYTSNFTNIENNSQLLKYKGQILYAKLNEIGKNIEEEVKKTSQNANVNEINKNKFIKINNYKRNNTIKEYPSIIKNDIIRDNTFGNSLYNFNIVDNKNRSIDFDYTINQDKNSYEETNYMNRNSSYINLISNKNNQSESFNMIPDLNPNANDSNYGYEDQSYKERIIKSHSFKIKDSINQNKNNSIYTNNSILEQENNKINCFSKTKVVKMGDPHLIFTRKKMTKSKSDLIPKHININNNFPLLVKKEFPRTLYKNISSQEIPNYNYNKNNIDVLNSIDASNNSDQNYNFISRNKIKYKTKFFHPFNFNKFRQFSRQTKLLDNEFKKIKNIFSNNNFNALDLNETERKKKQYLKEQQNLKIIHNFLSKPSIITKTKNYFYDDIKENLYNGIKNIFNNFRSELKDISCKLDEFISDKEIEIYTQDLETAFKVMGIDLLYCLKEYCLYSYFDKYIKKNYPSFIEYLLNDPKESSEEISKILNSLINHIHKLQTEERFNLIEYVRALKSIKNCKLSSDFFEIFVLCPNYFEFTKRQITKKIVLVLEIDSVTNNVSPENFMNYYYIFRFGHLVKLEKKLIFITKLLHMIEGKGGPLHEKIISDVQYLFKIDNRTKQILLGRPYEIRLNFHMILKINQIFNSIVRYFEGIIIKNNKSNLSNSSYFSLSN